MHLADFYKKENISIDSDDISKRQKSIDRYSKLLSEDKIKELILCYLGIDVIKNSTSLSGELHKDDAAFSSYNNERELSIISAFIIFSNHRTDNVLHLSVLTSSLNGMLETAVSPELILKLQHNFKEKSINERKNGLLEFSPYVYPIKKMPLISHEAKESIDGENETTEEELPVFIEMLRKSVEEQQFYFKEMYNNLNDCFLKMQQQHKFAKEESDILWWMMSCYSSIYNESMVDLDVDKAYISAAYDFANLITSSFGPTSALNIISRAALCGRTTENIQQRFGAIIEKTPDGMSNLFNEEKIKNNKNQFPVTYAIFRKDEFGSGEQWKTKYKSEMHVDTEIEIEIITFANLLFHEMLLSKLLP